MPSTTNVIDPVRKIIRSSLLNSTVPTPKPLITSATYSYIFQKFKKSGEGQGAHSLLPKVSTPAVPLRSTYLL